MFNHEARWDRTLPADDPSGSGALISVLCIMDKGNVTPRSFTCEGQTFTIEKINFSWKDKQGREDLRFFSVKTDKGTYQLLFRETGFLWHLNKLLGP